MDRIFIRGIEVQAIIGIYDYEREQRQRVVLDLELATDVARAAATENIDDALNYKAVTDALIAFVAGSEFLLIETLAEAIVTVLQNDFGVTWCRLTLHKPEALGNGIDVGVIIERGSAS